MSRTPSLAMIEAHTQRYGDGADDDHDVRPPDYSDDALALHFSTRHAGHLRYVAQWGTWLRFEAGRWREEHTRAAYDLARAICRKAASGCNDPRLKRKLADATTVAAVERLAQADRRHAATVDQWDDDPWLLNTPGGTVNLRTGQLHAHDPAQHLTKITAVAPDSKSACPTWLAFLCRVTNCDSALVAYMQRLAGYCLTGSTAEQMLAFLYGTGANGKSVFLNTLSGILGDYARTAPIETFTIGIGERHPTELAMLRGARLVTAVETEEGRRWAESRIKALTGGDRIAARFMRQDFFEFVPQFKLLIAGNHKPSLRTVDEAIRRRLHLIPFMVTIPSEERDPALAEKLTAEWPAILRWAIDGCLAWQASGPEVPTAVRAATDDYLAAEDAFGEWLGECVERTTFAHETTADLFGAWKAWADRAGEQPGTAKRFSQQMIARGFEPARQGGSGKAGFAGVRLIRPNYTDDPRYGG